jgi:type II secretory pathway component GspD/PulD (secretin)
MNGGVKNFVRISLTLLVMCHSVLLNGAEEMQWKAENFESTRVQSELQDVLRSLVRQNGQNVDFRPGVEGLVTFDFNMPLQEAFNRLITQNGLTYDYDSRTNTLNIGPYRGPRTKVFYTPSSISLDEVRAGIERFGMSGETQIIFDPITQSLLISGDETSVANVAELVQNLDQALIKRQQTVLEQERQKLDLQREEQSLRLEQQRSALEIKRLSSEIETAGPVSIEVIQLRFASVGAVNMSFMGEDVSVPGIDETLKNILGTQLESGTSSADGASSMLIGNKAIVSMDLRTNSVIVRGTEAEIDEVKDIVSRLDQPLPMIEIEVMVVQASDEARGALGVQWAIGRTIDDYNAGLNTGVNFQSVEADTVFLGDKAQQILPDISDVGGSEIKTVLPSGTIVSEEVADTTVEDYDQKTGKAYLENIFESARGIVQQIAIPSFGENASGTTLGSIIYGGDSSFVQATISALESEGMAQTLASPRIVVLNNVTAKVAKADTLNVQIKNNQTGDVGFEAIQTGLQLEITPSVVPDEETGELTLIRLNINASNSALSAVTTTQNATTNDELQTQVIIPDGATFMLGGLFANTRTELRDGIPILSKIPLLGRFFGSKSSIDVNSETMFFITPKILDTGELVSKNGESVRRYLKSREQQMQGSREKISTESHLLKLEKEEGQ